jgi:hypothetical protein
MNRRSLLKLGLLCVVQMAAIFSCLWESHKKMQLALCVTVELEVFLWDPERTVSRD